MKTSNFIVYLFFIFTSCVEPIDVGNIFQPTIVVEGLITDQAGPYLIKISRAIPINPVDQLDKPRFETGATVVIQDDQGNSEALVEKSSGNYYTSSLQGVIGRTYTLSITTIDGHTYQSTGEKMLPVGDFTNLRYTFVQNEPPPLLYGVDEFGIQWTRRTAFYRRNVHTTNGFMVYLDAEVLPEQEDRIWWRWNGTFKIIAYPQMQVEYVSDGGRPDKPIIVPDVDDCSGFRDLNRHDKKSHLYPLGQCTCCTCWVTESNTSTLISDPRLINNGEINAVNIAFIEADRRTFFEKYYLEVEQLSVSVDVYNFWKNIKVQKRNSSNLFQTPPPKTGGNVTPSSTNSMAIIGYFATSAIKKHSIIIDRSAVPYNVGIIDTLAFDCRKAYQYSSNAKPAFW